MAFPRQLDYRIGRVLVRGNYPLPWVAGSGFFSAWTRYPRALLYYLNLCLIFVDGAPTVCGTVVVMAVNTILLSVTRFVVVFAAAAFRATFFAATPSMCMAETIALVASKGGGLYGFLLNRS